MQQNRAMVIVGAGHVGGRAAQALREFGWRGPIVLIGAEAALPYERPPLSKELLTGARTPESCALRPAEAYDVEQISHVRAWVESIDPQRRELLLAGDTQGHGRRIAYEALLLATGGHLRRLDLPGAERCGLLGLRTLDDAAALAPRLQSGVRLLVIGGGFIGLEVAASARQRGCAVTLLEGAPRLLGRSVPAALAERVTALHRAQGVELRLGTQPQSCARLPDGSTLVTLGDGSTLVADVVVVGIGIEPATELAERAGLAVGRGITVNAELATSVPGIWAAGDAVEFPSALSGALIRQETWLNAETQARTAAANMLGGHEAYVQTPWFWSDQYDHQIQVAGEPALGVRSVTRWLGTEPRQGVQIDFHLDAAGRLVGASGFGPTSALAKEFRLARLLVERRRSPDPAALADPDLRLKSLA